MQPKKIVFLDRDGVINKKAEEHAYITSVEDFIFNEGIIELCTHLQAEGFEFIVITNQRGVARGHLTHKDLLKIHDYMCSVFNQHGIDILAVYYCPHEIGECVCRKPAPGMLIQATQEFDIDVSKSILISDSKEDIVMGKAFGVGYQLFVPSDEVSTLFTTLYI